MTSKGTRPKVKLKESQGYFGLKDGSGWGGGGVYRPGHPLVSGSEETGQDLLVWGKGGP